MAIRYIINRETGQPHILDHGVTGDEVEEVLDAAPEDLPGRNSVRIATGQTLGGRTLRVIYAQERASDEGVDTVIVTGIRIERRCAGGL